MKFKFLYRVFVEKLKKAGISNPELEARVLVCHGLKIDDAKFYLWQEHLISPTLALKIFWQIKQRVKNIPLAYVIGEKEFYWLKFKVNKNVLIPRPETEGIVELALDRIKNQELRIKRKSIINDSCFKILDLGTGSGNIIITLANATEANYYATDISKKALRLAKKNAKIHNVDKKIKFYCSDLFSNKKLPKKFDLIIANLPYVPLDDMNEKSIAYEPKNAIFAKDNGSEIIKKFLKQTPEYLNSNGTVLIELDPRNANELESYAKNCFPNAKIRLKKDLAGFLRYLVIEN